jgi:hypothetical protein
MGDPPKKQLVGVLKNRIPTGFLSTNTLRKTELGCATQFFA